MSRQVQFNADVVANEEDQASLWAYRNLLDVTPTAVPECQTDVPMSIGCLDPLAIHRQGISGLHVHPDATLRGIYLDSTATERSHPSGIQTSSSIKMSQNADVKPHSPPVNKMFKCTLDPNCEMEFTRAEHLARHERKHTKEKPFQCHCSKSFSRLDNWRQHKVSVHKEDTEENTRTESRLVQVHKSMQRQNNIRKAATIAAQRQQMDPTSPSHHLSSGPSGSTTHAPYPDFPPYSSQSTERPQMFLPSSFSVSNPAFTYPEPKMTPMSASYTPPLASSGTVAGDLYAPYLSEPSRLGADFTYASSSSVPYSTTDFPSMASSLVYNPQTASPYFTPKGMKPHSTSLDLNRHLFYPDATTNSAISTDHSVSKAPYSHYLMDPFNPLPSSPQHFSHPSSSPQTIHPLQPSRKLNVPAALPLDVIPAAFESSYPVSDLVSQYPDMSKEYPAPHFPASPSNLGPSHTYPSYDPCQMRHQLHSLPRDPISLPSSMAYDTSGTHFTTPVPFLEHTGAYLTSAPHDTMASGEDDQVPRCYFSGGSAFIPFPYHSVQQMEPGIPGMSIEHAPLFSLSADHGSSLPYPVPLFHSGSSPHGLESPTHLTTVLQNQAAPQPDRVKKRDLSEIHSPPTTPPNKKVCFSVSDGI